MTLTVGTPDAFACLTNLAVALGMLGVAVTAGGSLFNTTIVKPP